MHIANKTVVITGGTEGLGFSLAQAFQIKDAKVCIIGRSKEKLELATEKLGKEIKGFVADVRQFSQMQTVASQIGEVDVLINNAGVWIEGNIENNSEEKISDAIDINLKGVIYTTKAFLPYMQKSEEAHILNVSSTSGLKGREDQAVYVATKFGVRGFTESLQLDLANTKIKVSGFYPGGMRTTLFEKAGETKDTSDWMQTDQVAEIVVFMIERNSSMVIDHVVVNKRKA